FFVATGCDGFGAAGALAVAAALGSACSVIATASTSLSPLDSNASAELIDRVCVTKPPRLTSSACDFVRSHLWMVYGVRPTRLPFPIAAPGAFSGLRGLGAAAGVVAGCSSPVAAAAAAAASVGLAASFSATAVGSAGFTSAGVGSVGAGGGAGGACTVGLGSSARSLRKSVYPPAIATAATAAYSAHVADDRLRAGADAATA